MQYHYVVMYDSRTEKWEFDAETTAVKFEGKSAYDDETQDWIEQGHPDYDIHEDIYCDVATNLINTLEILSEVAQ